MASDRDERPLRPLADSFARTPVATLLAACALTLLLAAHIGTFAVVNTVLLRVLPVQDLSRLVHIWDNVETRPGVRQSYSVKAANYREWKKRQTTMARMGAFEPLSFNLTGAGDPVRLQGALISHDLLPTFGVEPAYGRGILESEDRPGAPPVALLGHDLWQSRFDGDPGVLGRQIRVDGRAHEVVGILPAGFYHPWHSEIWISLRLDPESPTADQGVLTVIGFMKPGVTIDEARADFHDVARQLEKDFPESHTGWDIEVNVVRGDLVGEIQPSLLALLAASLLLLVAGCLPASLLLGRAGAGTAGRTSFADLLPASLALAAAAGVAALALALAATETVVAASPLVTFTSYFKSIHFDGRVVLYALAAILASAALVAACGAGLSRTPAGSRRAAWVVGLPALAFALAVTASVWTGRDYFRQANADYGLRIDGLLSMRFNLPASRYSEAAARRAFFDGLLNRVRRLPGVVSAGVATDNPFAIHTRAARHSVEGHDAEPGTVLVVQHRLVSPDYLETLDVELVEGRLLGAGDGSDAPEVVVVNRSFAERYWPGESALDRRVKQGAPDSERPWLTVVGVIEDVQEDGREAVDQLSWYLPAAQYDDLREASLVVRADDDPFDLEAPIRDLIAELDVEQPVYDVLTLEQLRDRFTLFRPRFVAILSSLAAALTLVLLAAAILARRGAAAASD